MQPAATPLTPQERIEDTLHILSITANRLYHLLSRCIGVYQKTSNNPVDPELGLILGVKMFSVIQFSAFIDEFNQQFLKLKESGVEVSRIEKIERIIQPAIDIINLYPGIKDMRDTVLAHNSRTRVTRTTYTNSFRGNLISTLVTPATISEFMLVATACLEISKIIAEEFSDYFIQPEDFLAQYTIPNTVTPRSNDECLILHNEMHEKIELLKNQENHN